MITPTFIYWIGRLDAISTAATCIFLLSLLVCTILGVCLPKILEDWYDEDTKAALVRWTRRILLVPIVSGLISIFTPNAKEVAAMVVLPRIANSETIEQLGEGIRTLATEWMEDLRPKKKEASK